MNEFDPTIMDALRCYTKEDKEQSLSDLEEIRKQLIEKDKNSTSKSIHRSTKGESPIYDSLKAEETCSKIYPEKVDSSKHAFKKYTKPESTISKSLSGGFSSEHFSDFEMDVDDLCCTACNDMNTHPGNNLVECQVCRCLYHQNCHDPKIKDEESNGNQWCCSSCLQSTKKMTKTTKSHSFSSISPTDRMVSNGEAKTKTPAAIFPPRRDSKLLMENSRAGSSLASWNSSKPAAASYKRAEMSTKYSKEVNGISRQSYAKSKSSYAAGKSNTEKATVKEVRLWEDGMPARKSSITGRSNSTSSASTNKRANPNKPSMPPSKLQLTTNDSWLKGSSSNIKKSIKSTISLEATAPTRPAQMVLNREKAKAMLMKKKQSSKVPPARVRPGQL